MVLQEQSGRVTIVLGLCAVTALHGMIGDFFKHGMDAAKPVFASRQLAAYLCRDD